MLEKNMILEMKNALSRLIVYVPQTWLETVNFQKIQQKLTKLKHKGREKRDREDRVYKSHNTLSSGLIYA